MMSRGRPDLTRSGVLAGLIAVLVLTSPARPVLAQAAPPWLAQYRDPAARLAAEALGDTFAWQRLAQLTDTIGHRLSGSPELDRAITWAVAEMKRDGLENVHTEPVTVQRWIRGQESAEIVAPARQPNAMLGLGHSIGTAEAGVQDE